MARTSGFATTRHIHNFLRILNVDFTVAGVPEAGAIHEIRAMTGKYQPTEWIQLDLTEIAALELAATQNQTTNTEEE